MSGNLNTVLVIDDDSDVRCMTRELLEESGFIVFEAGGSDEAFVITDRITPNLIIIDVMLGGMTGWSVLRLLRSGVHTLNVPVIMISGSPDAVEEFAILSPANTSFLSKPFSTKELLYRIARILGNEESMQISSAF